MMTTFPELIASRRHWIDTVLQPWCKVACRKDLLMAEQEWQDIAGRPAPEATLWQWAWSRFPALCETGLPTLNEAYEVEVLSGNGKTDRGYPDARRSQSGQLFLIGPQNCQCGPLSIDDITDVRRVTS